MSNPEIPEQTPAHSVKLWKLGAYFLLVALFAVLNLELFRELGKDSYFQGFTKVQQLLTGSFDFVNRWDDIIVTLYSLLLTFVFVVPIGWVYILTKEDEGIDPSMAQTLVVLGLVVCGVMMLVQDNLARAFGLVGIVAAVRYRNTLREAKDAVYVFLAIGVGMGCGLHAFHIALLLSITISGVFILLWKFGIGKLQVGAKGTGSALLAQADAKQRKKMQLSISSTVQKEIEREIELETRLWNLSGLMADKDKGIKRPNAALIIRASNAPEAQRRIHSVLESKDQNWQLTAITSLNGSATFEYLGRINKTEPLPASLVQELEREGRPYITSLEFRSLKRIQNERMRADENGREPVSAVEQPHSKDKEARA